MTDDTRDDAPDSAAPACPRCGLPALPVAFGFPSAEMLEAVDKGLLALGGCVVDGDDPDWTCAHGHSWTLPGGRSRSLKTMPHVKAGDPLTRAPAPADP